MKYKVTVKRTEVYEHTFEVEASSEEDAELAALEEAEDYSFRDEMDSFRDEVVYSTQ